ARTQGCPARRGASSGMADGPCRQGGSQRLAAQQSAAGPARLGDAARSHPGARCRRRGRLFGDLPACRLRGQRLGRGAEDARVLVPLLALRSARRSRRDRRADPALARSASAEARRRQARGGEAFHWPRRHRADLIDSKGRSVMSAKRTFLQSAAALVAAGLSTASAQKPEDGNWFHFRRTYDGWGFSPLTEINAKNVGRLQLVWSMATGQVEGHQAPPIVNNGVMFVATPGNQMLAIEAKTGNLLWRYKRRLPEDVVHLHPTNRGVALYGDKVYFASADCVLVALDARTGKEVWTADVDDYRKAHYMSLAPLIVDGKVILGASGGELGVRGFVAAVDAETGKQLWKTYTIPAPGEPGSETWPAGGDHYKRGGGAVWITGTYDPETNLTFWGTGNAAPWFGDQRPGDNLYTSSVVALDVNSGAIKGHFQYHPNDSWDWDEVSPPIVVDYKRDGKTVKGLINVSRSGYIWDLERTTGRINFVAGRPYVRQNVFKSLDPKTGRPVVDEARKPGTGKGAEFCPSLWGGKDWPPAAFSPRTRLIYIPANDNLCHELVGETPKYVVGERYMGVAKNVMKIVEGADHI